MSEPRRRINIPEPKQVYPSKKKKPTSDEAKAAAQKSAQKFEAGKTKYIIRGAVQRERERRAHEAKMAKGAQAAQIAVAKIAQRIRPEVRAGGRRRPRMTPEQAAKQRRGYTEREKARSLRLGIQPRATVELEEGKPIELAVRGLPARGRVGRAEFQKLAAKSRKKTLPPEPIQGLTSFRKAMDGVRPTMQQLETEGVRRESAMRPDAMAYQRDMATDWGAPVIPGTDPTTLATQPSYGGGYAGGMRRGADPKASWVRFADPAMRARVEELYWRQQEEDLRNGIVDDPVRAKQQYDQIMRLVSSVMQPQAQEQARAGAIGRMADIETRIGEGERLLGGPTTPEEIAASYGVTTPLAPAAPLAPFQQAPPALTPEQQQQQIAATMGAMDRLSFPAQATAPGAPPMIPAPPVGVAPLTLPPSALPPSALPASALLPSPLPVAPSPQPIPEQRGFFGRAMNMARGLAPTTPPVTPTPLPVPPAMAQPPAPAAAPTEYTEADLAAYYAPTPRAEIPPVRTPPRGAAPGAVSGELYPERVSPLAQAQIGSLQAGTAASQLQVRAATQEVEKPEVDRMIMAAQRTITPIPQRWLEGPRKAFWEPFGLSPSQLTFPTQASVNTMSDQVRDFLEKTPANLRAAVATAMLEPGMGTEGKEGYVPPGVPQIQAVLQYEQAMTSYGGDLSPNGRAILDTIAQVRQMITDASMAKPAVPVRTAPRG